MTTSKGLVFDIKRFAVHDGEGIRATIFLKGCPLRCLWCQNPEGLRLQQQVIYFSNKCIHCQLCKSIAKSGEMVYDNNRPMINQDYQGSFDHLIEICPSTALRYDSHYYSVDELFDKIKEDEVFFQNGGGVTFSGGEPFMQYDFLYEMLKKCHDANIHTAIETSFYTSIDHIKKVLPYLDQIYVDLKIFDDDIHQKYTQVSNQRIKQNIAYLLKSEHKDKVIIRTPLIPSISATKDNIRAIANYLVSLNPHIHYELLNYNPLASAKYELVHMDYQLPQYQPFDQNQMQEFYDIVYQSGIKNLII